MEKLTSFLEKYLVPFSTKLSANRFLKSISEGFSILLPVVMAGAIFTLLANFQIAPYQDFITMTHIKEILSFVPTVTTDMLAIYLSFLVGSSLCRNLGEQKGANIAGVLSLFAFLLMIPLGVSEVQGEATVTIAAALGTKWLGSAGLFSAMLIGLTVPVIYVWIVKRNWTIKMPEGVPPTIANSFSALIPGFIIAFLFASIRYGFSLTSFGSVNQFIYTMLQAPLTSLGASPFTYIVLILLCSMLWFFGLHGGMIIMPIMSLLYTAPGLENLAAYAQGSTMPNYITMSNWQIYASLGGAGGTFGLCILMVIFSKSKRYKTLGSLAIAPGVCGINEPVTFGMPMVLNTTMIIPFVLTPIITFTISYICTATGIVEVLNGTQIPLGTPIIMSALVAGGWRVAVLQVVLILIQMAIYFPFFRVLDRQACIEEENQQEEVQA